MDRALITRVWRFALVSGAGLALDVGLFLALTEAGIRAGYANLLSASAAVTFVYFVSTKRVFDYQGRFLMSLFVLYAGYQAIAVTAASWAVDFMVVQGLASLVAKIAILPLTFGANYLFMDFLTRRGAKSP